MKKEKIEPQKTPGKNRVENRGAGKIPCQLPLTQSFVPRISYGVNYLVSIIFLINGGGIWEETRHLAAGRLRDAGTPRWKGLAARPPGPSPAKVTGQGDAPRRTNGHGIGHVAATRRLSSTREIERTSRVRRGQAVAGLKDHPSLAVRRVNPKGSGGQSGASPVPARPSPTMYEPSLPTSTIPRSTSADRVGDSKESGGSSSRCPPRNMTPVRLPNDFSLAHSDRHRSPYPPQSQTESIHSRK